MCVLQLYDWSRQSACTYFRSELMEDAESEVEHFEDNSDPGWKANLPWLYYENTPRQTLRRRRRFNMRQALDRDHSRFNRFKFLRFYLARYSIDGHYQGIQELKNQLSVCPMDHADQKTLKKFGTVYNNHCTFFLSELISDELSPPEEANVFYELFLQDGNNELVDVPVLITNYKNEEGRFPNKGRKLKNSWQLVRRFFVLDTLSGIERTGGYKQGFKPSIVRFATKIELQITLDSKREEAIYLPLLRITY